MICHYWRPIQLAVVAANTLLTITGRIIPAERLENIITSVFPNGSTTTVPEEFTYIEVARGKTIVLLGVIENAVDGKEGTELLDCIYEG